MKKKIIKIMKLSSFLFLLTILQVWAVDSYSQHTKLTLDLKNVTVEDALKTIEDQSEFFFLYSPKMFDVSRKVDIELANKKVDFILNQMFAETGVSWVVKDRQIVITTDEMIKSFKKETPQQIVVTGKVTDEDGNSLPGVNIVVKGTLAGTITDLDGNYSFEVDDPNAILVFSFIGYVSQEILVNNQTTINVALKTEAYGLDEVVAIGYGVQKRATITGSISTVKAESLKASSSINFTNALTGRVPGVVVVTRSGEPGNDASTIRIRGSNTLGNNSPLIVIDGVTNRSIQRLNPENIENVTVLKDASAAIYGSQAANGVILITTKRGKIGKSRVNITLNQGWSMPTVIPETCDAATYATLLNEIDMYAGKPLRYTNEEIQKFADGSDPLNYPNTDWFGETYKPAALQKSANFSVNGGSERLKYYISVGGNFQDGIYKNSATSYSQANFRSNIDGKISENINISFDISGRQENKNFPTESNYAIFNTLIRAYPTSIAYWPNGKPGPDIAEGWNPVVITTNETGYDKNKSYIFENLLKLDINIPWIKGLSVTANASMDKRIQNSKTWEVPWYLYSWDGVSYDENNQPVLRKDKKGLSDPKLTNAMYNYSTTTLNALVNYERSFNDKHNFRFLVGSEMISGESENFSASRRHFVSESIDQLFAGGDLEKTNYGSAGKSGRLNYFSRINYDFLGKYLVELIGRYDGSYIFPKNKRFGFFPGVSVGWRISEEDFWRNNLALVNYFKLRGSWGQTGNDRVAANQHLASYAFATSRNYWYGFDAFTYIFNNDVESKLLQEVLIPNPDITWEVANQSNIGFDAKMFNNSLSFSGEYFYNLRSNILCQRNASVPSTTGLRLPRENIGKVVNQGVEFIVDYKNKIGELNYDISVMGGFNKNRIKFWDETPGIPDYQQTTGHPMNSKLLYNAIGIFKDDAAVDAYPHWSNARPGDVIFEDVNGDGEINGLDRIRIYKSSLPTFDGGMNINLAYKNFYSSIFIQWAAGGITTTSYQEQQGEAGNFLVDNIEGRWTEDNINATKPRTWNWNGEYWRTGVNNTYWIKDNDYIRLKNFELGYNLPNGIPKLGISNLRIYLNGVNLITLDKLENFDPECQTHYYYPLNKVFNIGVKITI